MLGKTVEELGRMSINGFIAFFSSCYSFMVSKNHSKNGFSYMYSIPWFHNQTAPNLLLVLKKEKKKGTREDGVNTEKERQLSNTALMWQCKKKAQSSFKNYIRQLTIH